MDRITDRRLTVRALAVMLPVLVMFGWMEGAQAQTRLDPKSDDCTDLYAAKLYPVALSACQSQAEAKDNSAQFTLGLMYYFGQGTVQDYAKAFVWFKRAAKSRTFGGAKQCRLSLFQRAIGAAGLFARLCLVLAGRCFRLSGGRPLSRYGRR
jgi:hypothetical protein